MSRLALDTNVLVAAMQSWHSAHDRATQAVSDALRAGSVVVPVQVLFETYSVLTRTPKPRRLSPADALKLLEGTLHGKAEIVDLGGESTFELLQTLPGRDIAGGAAYDALIAATAIKAGANAIVTLNTRDFERVAPQDLEVVTP